MSLAGLIRTLGFVPPKAYSFLGSLAACLGRYLKYGVLSASRLSKDCGNDRKIAGLFRRTERFLSPAKSLLHARSQESTAGSVPRGFWPPLLRADCPCSHICSCAWCNSGCHPALMTGSSPGEGGSRCANSPLREALIAANMPSFARLATSPGLGVALAWWTSSRTGH